MLDKNFFTPRRADRTTTDEDWIKNFLQRTNCGVLATGLQGQLFVNNNLWVYGHYRPITPEKITYTAVIYIAIEHRSAKRQQVPEAFPKAFSYEVAHA